MDTMSSDKYQSFSLSSIRSETTRHVCGIWGGELSAESRTCIFESKKDYILHLLSLWTICLGGTTKDEMHVIAVETDQTLGHPVIIASLKPSLQPMVNLHGVEFTSPVTFILESGSGPVYISGQHITLDDGLEGLEPEENLSFQKVIPEHWKPESIMVTRWRTFCLPSYIELFYIEMFSKINDN